MSTTNTKRDLEKRLGETQQTLMSANGELLAARDARRAAEVAARECRERAAKEVADIRQQFDDLKKRLHAAETSNQFMRGYLARVQEDDTVREELVTMGDPNGEQHMVPKRKPTVFKRPEDFSEPTRDRDAYLYDHQRQHPRHWINY